MLVRNMAVHAKHTFLLLLGFIFMMSKSTYSVVVAHQFKLNSELEGHPQLESEQDAIRIRKIDYEANMATKADIPPENQENDSPVLQGRGIIITNGFFGHSHIGGGRLDIGMGSLTIRARNPKNQLNVSISNNKVFLRKKVVCDNINKQLDKATYQKTSDGTQWYTNIKIGEPMTQAEIEDFKADWAQHEKEREERRKQREAERKQRQKEMMKYRQQREVDRRQRKEERERKRKEREEERERYRQEREAKRRQREEERKRQLIKREEERQQREAERRQRVEERGEREQERERERREMEGTREMEGNEWDEEDSKPRKNKKGAKSPTRRAKTVTYTRGGKRPKKEVNMHTPYRSGFMEGFMDGFMDDFMMD